MGSASLIKKSGIRSGPVAQSDLRFLISLETDSLLVGENERLWGWSLQEGKIMFSGDLPVTLSKVETKCLFKWLMLWERDVLEGLRSLLMTFQTDLVFGLLRQLLINSSLADYIFCLILEFRILYLPRVSLLDLSFLSLRYK